MESINVSSIVEYVLTASGAFAWLAAIFNKEYSNKYVNYLVKLINLIGGNVWKAANKATDTTETTK
jgi:hypothetical protein